MVSDPSPTPSDSPPSPTTPPPLSPPAPSSPPPPPSTTSPPPPPPTTSPPPSSPSPPPPASLPPPKDSTSPPPPPPSTSQPPAASPPPPPASSPPPRDSPLPPPPPPQSSNSPPPPPPPPSSSKTPSPPPPPSKDKDDSPTSSPLPPPPPLPSTPNSSNDAQPPPPPRQLSPPSRSSPPSSFDSVTPASDGGSTSSSTMPIIIGVAVGVGLLLIVIMILLYLSCAKKKKKQDQPQYYPSHPANGGWNKGANTNDHILNIPPPPPGNHGAWPAPPLPSPPAMNVSSGLISSNFSGPHSTPLPPPHPALALGFNKSTFSYDELEVATGGFSQANLLGQGGFGYVHKGVFPDGKEVAVKSLKSGSGQGEREFRAEVEIISRVHHRHLVSLIGYCIAGGIRMLVYEFLPNKTLEYHLHGRGRPTMDWATRLKIALGSAKGLAYLHEDCHPRIIHRDIKGANILLDHSFETKVADFGLAKLNDQDNFTHVSTRVMGTFGYLAPEYASSGKLTEKSDVFSYGVMLLELITGRHPVDPSGDLEDSLVDWARPLCARAMEDGNFDELADPRLENNYLPHEMARMVACAAGSIRHSARRRPKMSQIVRALEGDVSLEDFKEGVKPGRSLNISSSTTSSERDAGSYGANMKKFRKMAIDSNDCGSSDYEATSEYGLNPSSTSSSDHSQEIMSRKGSKN